MAGVPEGDPAPADGALASGRRHRPGTDFGIYLHVPFCSVRCGYCDFNTYTPRELGAGDVSGPLGQWARAVHQEIDLAASVLAASGDGEGTVLPQISTVFIGGGTPSLAPGPLLAGLLDHLRTSFGIEADAEITSEANPESVNPAWLEAMVGAGLNRLSLGMQSSEPEVLRLLERQHSQGRVAEVVAQARAAGITNLSLDLIMGTPGESLAQWQASLDHALALGPDHLSAYSLIVEEGTRFAARVRRGEVPMTDQDDHADKYLLAEQVLNDAGMVNYEVSNWARPRPDAGPAITGDAPPTIDQLLASRHNLAYWTGQDWWGLGPGAHSHVDGMRWWNHKLPARYAAALDAHTSPALAREVLDEHQRRIERVLLELRTLAGLPLAVLRPSEVERLQPWQASGHAVLTSNDAIVLTLAGRLLADRIILDLLD